jgi:hypothetical protein
MARVAGFAYIFFRFKAKKIPNFSLNFALSEYERRTLILANIFVGMNVKKCEKHRLRGSPFNDVSSYKLQSLYICNKLISGIKKV